jgi:hypothetical protein
MYLQNSEKPMTLLARFCFSIFLATTCLAPALAQEANPLLRQNGLVAFSSDEGIARRARATAKADFAPLANQFEAQSNALFCGPTTAAIVLNALHGRDQDMPRDRGRLRAEDLRHLPDGFDPAMPRYTQDNVIAKGKKTRAQILGEPVTLQGKPVQDFGYQLRQFDELLRAHGLATRLRVVDDKLSVEQIRADLVDNLQHRDDYVIVNYRRDAVGQQGGGHISPLGAYDAESDSFLVLDVNPAAAGWVWMPAAALVRGMRTFDTAENRGYILVEAR